MPVFSYEARNAAGRSMRGQQEAASATALATTLRGRGWLVLNVQAAVEAGASNPLALLNPLQWLPIRSIHIEQSCQQIAVMLKSGLTLLTSLRTVAEQAQRRRMRTVWEDVARRIQQGSSLTDALSQHPCFAQIIIQLVRVGEQTGTLDQVLNRAAEVLERRRMLRTQLITALIYPTIVLVAAIGVTAYMIFGLIPKLRIFLSAVGRKLPAMTQFLLDMSDAAMRYLPAIAIGLLALTVTIIVLYRWPPGRFAMDRTFLRIPVAGWYLRLAATVQFAHGLTVLLRSGVTLVEGLRTVERLHGNRFVARRVAEARNSVLGGTSLAQPLGAPGVFMPMLARLVAVGESAGTLEETLDEVTRFHENQLRSAIRQLSAIVEPVIIMVVGGIVGFVYIAFFMALFAAAGSSK